MLQVSVLELRGERTIGKILLIGLMTNKIFVKNVGIVLVKVPIAVLTTGRINVKILLTEPRIELMIDEIDVNHLDLLLL